MSKSEPERAHELQQFIAQVSAEIDAEYERIVARATEDPGTAGDEGEENWATLLRKWLPATYHVVTKGRLLATSGEASPQIDVLVLYPSYPPALLEKKLYLAAGVAAAFECKLTLRPEHIRRAAATSARLRQFLPARWGSPYKELFTPLTYGLLSHSHAWKAERSTPVENINRGLWKADQANVNHPREMLDVLCVADLACWNSGRGTFIGPSVTPWGDELASMYGPAGSATSTYVGPGEHGSGPGNPIGVFIAKLLRRLAWEDTGLRGIADYWQFAGLWGSGSGDVRLWDPADVYTLAVADQVINGRLVNGEPWNEWSIAFL
jgi:hypothetical protein